MEMDFLDPQGAEHMPEMADSSFALDFYSLSKVGFILMVLHYLKQRIPH